MPSAFLAASDRAQDYCQISDGAQFISDRFDMNTSTAWMWGDAAITLSFFSTFVLVTYLGIRFVNHLKR